MNSLVYVDLIGQNKMVENIFVSSSFFKTRNVHQLYFYCFKKYYFFQCLCTYILVRGSAVWIYLPVLYVFSCHRCTQGVIWSYLCLQTRHGPSSYSDPPRNGRSSHLPTINTRSGIAHSEFDNVIFNVTCEEFNTIYSFTMSLVNRDNISNNQRRSLHLKYE